MSEQHEPTTDQKEAHRLGTINRWDPPEADWAAEYDWTRYRGPDPWPVPGGWLFNDPEEGGHWQYYGDAGVGHYDDTKLLDALEADDSVEDPYDALDEARGPRAFLQVETANPEEVSLRNPEDEELAWTLTVDGMEVFSCVEPDRADLMAAVAEALAAYHGGDLEDRIAEIAPTSGRRPDEDREQRRKERELEQKKEQHRSLRDYE